MNNLGDAYYIDTREGALGCFGDYTSKQAENYKEWLTRRYRGSHRNSEAVGAAQRINAMIHAAKQGTELLALGPHSCDAAEVIEAISGGMVQVKIICSHMTHCKGSKS